MRPSGAPQDCKTHYYYHILCSCPCHHQVAVTVPSATPKFFSTPDTQQIAISTQRSLLTQVRCRGSLDVRM